MAELEVPSTGAEEARRIADDVLARREFAEAEPSLWDRFMQWLGDQIGLMFEAIGSGGRGTVVGLITLLVVGGVAVFFVVRYTRTVRRDPGMDLAMDEWIGRSSREWMAEAAEHEAAGQWRDAVRCRYRGLLADFAAAGLVDEVAGRTSGEYLTAIREDVPAAAEDFADVTRRFEAAWYGHQATAAADVEAFRAAARRVASAAGLRRSLASAGV